MKDYVKLDSIDCNILDILQQDATSSIQSIADRVGLSNNPCWRRIKRLEEQGVILRRVALVNPALVGLTTTAFVSIRIDTHSTGWLNEFANSIARITEITECHRMTGDVDYLLKVLVRDLPHYDQVYQRLIAEVPGLIDVSSIFSMEQLQRREQVDLTTARGQ